MTTVLTVRVPNIGTERYALSLYDADGGGHQEWLASELTLTTFVNLVVEWSQGADFVCVDVTGVGVALADLLEDRHVGVLCMRRGRQLNREIGAMAIDYNQLKDAINTLVDIRSGRNVTATTGELMSALDNIIPVARERLATMKAPTWTLLLDGRVIDEYPDRDKVFEAAVMALRTGTNKVEIVAS